MNDPQILAFTISCVFAGSDSTSIAIYAIFSYLLEKLHTMTLLREELGPFPPKGLEKWSGVLDHSPRATASHYCCQPSALPPSCGLYLSGGRGAEVNQYLTLGRTTIGASAWALPGKGEMFEQRAEEVRPERWLEAGEVERERTDNALMRVEVTVGRVSACWRFVRSFL